MHDDGNDGGNLAMVTLHLICCAAPLLFFGMIAVAPALRWERFVAAVPYLGLVGVIAGVAVLYYYFAHGCRRCPTSRDETRPLHHGEGGNR